MNTAFDESDGWGATAKQVWTKKRPAGKSQLREIDPAQAYGHRPRHPDVWHLSPYEFVMHWDVVPMKVPSTRLEWQTQPAGDWDVTVTQKGEAKLMSAKMDDAPVHLQPGTDTQRRQGQPRKGQIFFDSVAGRGLQHGWYLSRRLRPLCPHLANSPVPSKWGDDTERNAKLALAYFKAWTLNKRRGEDAVPYLPCLRVREETWEESLRQWLLRLPCAETKNYVGNFLGVYRVRPENEGENSDDEDDAEELVVTEQDLPQACKTYVAGPDNETEKKGKWSAHRGLVVEAMEQANKFWDATASELQAMENPYESLDSANVLKSARQKPKAQAATAQMGLWEPEIETQLFDITGAKQAVQEWSARVGEEGCNEKQAEMCQKVATQVLEEMCAEGSAGTEPLRWALHGGPGTGKSYVLNRIRKELFEKVLGWKQGEEFQVVTLQAVMAKDLDGDTIHHAFGLNWQGLGDERISGHKLLELCQKALRWRWLIIDEISMVSAELLARLELRCRELVRDLAQGKYAKDQANARPFGGLNVILAGDMWQLPPPRGTFLGDVPWEWLTNSKNKKVAHTIHGQELVWGTGPNGLHGLTELVECERTRDVWLQGLQNEVRDGKLSESNHAFLHGRQTPVPGSWNGHRLECGDSRCQALLTAKASPQRISEQECSICREERTSKARVVDGRMTASRDFANAKAIFATNAVKYHVNKLRARAWATEHGQALQYAIAKDKISSVALREKPDLGQDKLIKLVAKTRPGLRGVVRGVAALHWHANHSDRPFRSRTWNFERVCWGCGRVGVAIRSRRDKERREEPSLEPATGVHFGSL